MADLIKVGYIGSGQAANYEVVTERPIAYETPLEMLRSGRFVKICAPMVRYSKLPFRLLVKRWGCDILYTPMITAQEFALNADARKGSFSTNRYDRPLIVQFGAKTAHDLAIASQYVANSCDGVDINCGCPQKWAIKEGIGCGLLTKPELIADMVRQAHSASGLPISIKIRIDPDLNKTVELARRAEAMGAAWVTVHGRTSRMKSSYPVNYDAVKTVKDALRVPVIGNGHCFKYEDALEWREKAGVNGVMAARGLLQNPALFAKHWDHTPPECVAEFLDITLRTSISPDLFHNHLLFMLSTVHTKIEKRVFNNLQSLPSILEYFTTQGLKLGPVDLEDGVTRSVPEYYVPR